MGGGEEETGRTGSSNPLVNTTLNTILGRVNGIAGQGSDYYSLPTYSGVGNLTRNSWQSSLDAAGNPDFAGGVQSSILGNNDLIRNNGMTGDQRALYGEYGDLGHAYDSETPGVQQLRSNLISDTSNAVNSTFNNSGRFGGGSNVQALGKGIGDALAGFDSNIYDKSVAARNASLGARSGLASTGIGQMFSAQNQLPQLFSSSLLPSQVAAGVGAANDADNQAARTADYDLWNRRYGADTDRLAQLTGILGSGAQAGGTTTYGQQQPWWQTILGAGVGVGSLLL